MREVVRGQFEGFNFFEKDKDISRIFNDESLCENFGWDLFTLYRQPLKRRVEFSILLSARAEMEKRQSEKSKNEMRSGRR